jgi:glutaredoxin 3
MPASVTVFSTPGCKYCKRAKEALASAGVPYADVDVSRDPQLRQALAEATNARTVPQIFAGGALVGGSDELVAALDSGRFKELLLAGDASSSSSALPASLAAAVERAAAAAPPLESAAPSAARLPAELEPLAAAIADASNGIVAFASRGGGDNSSSGSKTFTGKQLLDWLAGPTAANAISSGSSSSPREAGAALLAANVVTRVARALPDVATAATVEEAAEYRLRADARRSVEWGAPLNAHYCAWQAFLLFVLEQGPKWGV